MLNVNLNYLYSIFTFQSLISALNYTLNLRYAFGSPFVIVNPIFLVPTKAKSREPAYSQTLNQNNIDRQRVKIKRARQAGRQKAMVEGAIARCMKLRRGGRHGERGMSSSVSSGRAVERWQEERFGRVRRMRQIFV